MGTNINSFMANGKTLQFGVSIVLMVRRKKLTNLLKQKQLAIIWRNGTRLEVDKIGWNTKFKMKIRQYSYKLLLKPIFGSFFVSERKIKNKAILISAIKHRREESLGIKKWSIKYNIVKERNNIYTKRIILNIMNRIYLRKIISVWV